MLDGRFDPALALLLTEEPDASDSPHPLAILTVAGIAFLVAGLVCFGLMSV